MTIAGEASAACDSADCVPNVARNVVEAAPCEPRPSYVFGLDTNGGTLICARWGAWGGGGAWVARREVALPCGRAGDPGEEAFAGNDLQPRTPGIPLKCAKIHGA